jgi:hypothetical protein
MFFDRFDIAEAYWCFFCDYHEGQWSKKYQRLSKMSRYFKPRYDLSYETLEENGRAIYDALVEKDKAECRHNTMIETGNPEACWKCADCGHVYGS